MKIKIMELKNWIKVEKKRRKGEKRLKNGIKKIE